MCAAIFLASAALLFMFADRAFAQSGAELEATIRAAVLSDPRSAEMTEADVDAIVSVLVTEAIEHDVSAEDITWRPEVPAPWSETADQPGAACSYGALLCALNDAFGFSDSFLLIPLLLAITSAILLFVIGSILLHHHGHHAFAGNLRREE
ncbi:hypothetical protein HY417_04075 [Candidatus Kaiserbacteria bacterium]|nr:hypothetical protein [Candidatus Kaiserbacteria bacterium]